MVPQPMPTITVRNAKVIVAGESSASLGPTSSQLAQR